MSEGIGSTCFVGWWLGMLYKLIKFIDYDPEEEKKNHMLGCASWFDGSLVRFRMSEGGNEATSWCSFPQRQIRNRYHRV